MPCCRSKLTNLLCEYHMDRQLMAFFLYLKLTDFIYFYPFSYNFFILFRSFICFIRMYIGRRFIGMQNTYLTHQVKGGGMEYIFWILIALIGVTPNGLRELGNILYIILRYRRRHK